MATFKADIATHVDLIASGIKAQFKEEMRKRLTAIATEEIETICEAAAKNIMPRIESAYHISGQELVLLVQFNANEASKRIVS